MNGSKVNRKMKFKPVLKPIYSTYGIQQVKPTLLFVKAKQANYFVKAKDDIHSFLFSYDDKAKLPKTVFEFEQLFIYLLSGKVKMDMSKDRDKLKEMVENIELIRHKLLTKETRYFFEEVDKNG
jgi:hypothetical protein